MAKEIEKTPLKKGKAQFMLIGEAKIGDYTFNMDKTSDKSDWIYNSMNLGVDCGKGNTIYADMMGGYGGERENVLYVHGVKDGKKDDYENRFTIDWEDRFDETVLETIGEQCFIKVGLEKDNKEKTFTKKFLSAYDAIEYIKEHLENGTVLNVKGNLKYQMYNDSVIMKKEITSIYLSKGEIDDYKAVFTQTILTDSEFKGKLDKEKASYPITGYVVEYVGKFDGNDIKTNVTFAKNFELEVDKTKPENTVKFMQKFFTPLKKGTLVELTVEGELLEGASTVNITIDDVPDDIKELIELGVITEEEAINKCAVGGNKEKRMIIRKPLITKKGEGDDAVTTIEIDKDKYTEEDLVFLNNLIGDNEKPPFDEDKKSAKSNKSTDDKKSDSKKTETKEEEDPDAWMKLLDED